MILILLPPLLFCLLLYDRPSFLDEAVNSDLLLPAEFFRDLALRLDTVRAFQLPRVPSLVPDLAVYGATQLLTGSWRLAHFAYGLFSLGALVVLGAWASGRSAASILAVALAILLSDLVFAGADEASVHFWLFLPVSHGGVFLVSLAALGTAWRYQRDGRPGWLALTVLLSAAGMASDTLFLIDFALPLAASLVLARRRALPLLAARALGLAIGQGFDRVLWREPDIFGFLLDPAAVAGNLRHFATAFGTPLGIESPVAMLLWGGCLAVALAYWRKRPVAPWWVAAMVAMAGTALAGGAAYKDVQSFRYMAPLLWWPVIAAAGLVPPIWAKRSLAGLSVLMAGLYLAQGGVHAPRLFSGPDALAQCILDHTEGAGLADYWYARYLTQDSDGRLQVEPITQAGTPLLWGNDPAWFAHDRRHPERAPDYRYVVVTPNPDDAAMASLTATFGRDAARVWDDTQWRLIVGLTPKAVTAAFGQPSRVVDCPPAAGLTRYRSPSTTIFVYDDGKLLNQRIAQAAPVVARRLTIEGQGICVPATTLFSLVDHQLDEGGLTARTGPDGGVATYGPYIDLPHRRLSLSFTYRLDAAAAGHWRVTAESGRVVVADGVLPSTGGEARTIAAILDPPGALHAAELVTLLDGAGTITVGQVALAPAEATGAPPCDSKGN